MSENKGLGCKSLLFSKLYLLKYFLEGEGYVRE